MKVSWTSLLAALLVLLGGAIAVGRELGDWSGWVTLVITISLIGGPLVLAAAWSWRGRRPGTRWLLGVLLAAVVLRMVLIPATGELSDDAARYHWDGKALAHGINPFLHAPDDPAVAHLWRDAVDDRINHPWNRTCYPPLAQVIFWAGYRLTPGSLVGLKVLGLLGELITWFLLARELDRRGRSRAWLLIIAWSPLLIFQGYLPGHVDLFNVPLVTLLVLATMAGHARRTGLYLALACLVKPLPLLFLPAIMRELGWRRSAAAMAVFAAVMLAGYAPFASAGWRLFQSTWLMATDWSFNGSLGALAEAIWPMRTAHAISMLLTAVGVLLVTWRGRDFLARALAAQVVFVVFTPTLFPWYLIGMYPLLVLRPEPALLALGATIPVADQVMIGYRTTGAWQLAWWARLLQDIPFYGLLVWQLMQERWRTWIVHWHRSLLVVAAVVMALLRLPVSWLPGPGRDEAAYHYWSHHVEPAYAPLVQATIKLSEGLFGPTPWALRVPALALGVLVLVLNDRRLRSAGAPADLRTVALLAICLTPWQMFAGSILHPDNFLLACLLGFVLAAQRASPWALVLTALSAVAAKPTGVLLLPVAFWMVGRLPAVDQRHLLAWRAVLALAAAGAVVLLLPLLPSGVSEFGRMADAVPLTTRVGSWALALAFLGGPVLLGLAVVGARQRLRALRTHADGAVRREALASLAIATVFLGFFALALVGRGQFKANWILPAAVLLLPTGRVALPRLAVAAGLVLALAGSVGQTVVMCRPALMSRLEDTLSRHGAHAYGEHAGIREVAVSSSRTWADHLRQYGDHSAFAASLVARWATTGQPLRWIVCDDYGLAAQVHWYLHRDEVRIVVPGDGVFVRTVTRLLAEEDPGALLVLPVNHAITDLWPELERRSTLATILHPITGAILTPWVATLPEPPTATSTPGSPGTTAVPPPSGTSAR